MMSKYKNMGYNEAYLTGQHKSSKEPKHPMKNLYNMFYKKLCDLELNMFECRVKKAMCKGHNATSLFCFVNPHHSIANYFISKGLNIIDTPLDINPRFLIIAWVDWIVTPKHVRCKTNLGGWHITVDQVYEVHDIKRNPDGSRSYLIQQDVAGKVFINEKLFQVID